MSEVWKKWQGYAVNGTFPLHCYLGGSDHSAVFLTELQGREPAEAAIKIVPALAPSVQSHLSRWESSTGLSHPHLLRILETGRCQLDVRLFQFVVMEYSDQNLAELLEHRALTEDEAREMLPPLLSALAFLHGRNLVQGRLKPANVLVVGDQIRLASDTVRAVSDAAVAGTASPYDPPELQDGICSTAGDIWALGVTLYEALTRKPPQGLEVRSDGVVLPPDFPAMFRDMVASCLRRRPFDRPKVAELEARLRAPLAAGKRGSIEVSQWEPISPPGAAAPAAAPPVVVEHVFRETPSVDATEPPRTAAPDTSVLPAAADIAARPDAGRPGSAAVAQDERVRSGGAPPAVAQPAVVLPNIAPPTAPRPMVARGDVVPPRAAQPAAARPAAVPPAGVRSAVPGDVAPPSAAQTAAAPPTAAPPAGLRSVAQGEVARPSAAQTVAASPTAVAPAGVRSVAQGDVARSSAAQTAAAPPTAAPPAGVRSIAQGDVARPSAAQTAAAPSAAAPPAGARSVARGDVARPSAAQTSAAPPTAAPPAGLRSVAQGGVARPNAAQPATMRPTVAPPPAPARPADVVRSAPAQPAVVRPKVAAPAVAQPAVVLPNIAPPTAPRPTVARGDVAASPAAVQPAIVLPNIASPAVVQPEVRGDVVRPAPAHPNAARPVAASASARSAAADSGVARFADARPVPTQPAAARLAVAAPAVVHSAGAQGAVMRPTPTQPATARPAGVSPAAVRPAVVQSDVARPSPAQPAAAQPAAARPAVAPPAVRRPAVVESDVARPGPTRSPVVRPTVAPEVVAQPAVSRPDFSAPDVAHAPVARRAVVQTEVAVPDVAWHPEQQPAATELTAVLSDESESPPSEAPVEQPAGLRSFLFPLALGTVAVAILVWAGMRAHTANEAPMPIVEPVPDEIDMPVSSASAVSGDTFAMPPPRAVLTTSKVKLTGGTTSMAARQLPASESAAPRVGIHQEFPDVPQQVRQNIHGHLRVAVRVIIDKDGSVFAALIDQPGSSRYFERLAIEAAKKWTFPAADTEASRLKLVRFDFTRDGTTGQADMLD